MAWWLDGSMASNIRDEDAVVWTALHNHNVDTTKWAGDQVI